VGITRFRRRRPPWTLQEQLLAANLGFNARHQNVFKGRALSTIVQVRGALTLRIVFGLSLKSSGGRRRTLQAWSGYRSDVSLARQQAAQATFDLEEVQARERDAQVAWPKASGYYQRSHYVWLIFPSCQCSQLGESVERFIDRTLEQRPDLWRKSPF